MGLIRKGLREKGGKGMAIVNRCRAKLNPFPPSSCYTTGGMPDHILCPSSLVLHFGHAFFIYHYDGGGRLHGYIIKGGHHDYKGIEQGRRG